AGGTVEEDKRVAMDLPRQDREVAADRLDIIEIRARRIAPWRHGGIHGGAHRPPSPPASQEATRARPRATRAECGAVSNTSPRNPSTSMRRASASPMPRALRKCSQSGSRAPAVAPWLHFT